MSLSFFDQLRTGSYLSCQGRENIIHSCSVVTPVATRPSIYLLCRKDMGKKENNKLPFVVSLSNHERLIKWVGRSTCSDSGLERVLQATLLM